ncbi:hypothetical protein FZC66_03640 [Priestia megaterium]|nr:hypothetical protein FZC66_03640 [Priestia megaterium]
MQIIQKVVVKQIVTEASKQTLYTRFLNRKQDLQKEIEQLRFQMKQMEKTKKAQTSLLYTQFEKERSSRLEKIEVIDFQIEQLNKLALGSELVESEMDALIEVRVGDNWHQLKKKKEIVIKDGIVVEIR